MPTFNHRHDCPGHCGRRVIHSMLACGPCWLELPQQLRDAVTKADNIRRRDPKDPVRIAAHRRAVAACLAWYRANTKETTTP